MYPVLFGTSFGELQSTEITQKRHTDHGVSEVVVHPEISTFMGDVVISELWMPAPTTASFGPAGIPKAATVGTLAEGESGHASPCNAKILIVAGVTLRRESSVCRSGVPSSSRSPRHWP